MIGKTNIPTGFPLRAGPPSTARRPLSPALAPPYPAVESLVSVFPHRLRCPAKPVSKIIQNQWLANSLRTFDFYNLLIRNGLQAIRVEPPPPAATAPMLEFESLVSAIPHRSRGPAKPVSQAIKNQWLVYSLRSFNFYKPFLRNRLRTICVYPPQFPFSNFHFRLDGSRLRKDLRLYLRLRRLHREETS